MIPAGDAVILDTTARTVDEVVAHMESVVRQCRPSTP
jgi:cytidylate kinase